eukprot:scaffold2236_cov385-Prasinococcus_capsulatus_cf.AAC.2
MRKQQLRAVSSCSAARRCSPSPPARSRSLRARTIPAGSEEGQRPRQSAPYDSFAAARSNASRTLISCAGHHVAAAPRPLSGCASAAAHARAPVAYVAEGWRQIPKVAAPAIQGGKVRDTPPAAPEVGPVHRVEAADRRADSTGPIHGWLGVLAGLPQAQGCSHHAQQGRTCQRYLVAHHEAAALQSLLHRGEPLAHVRHRPVVGRLRCAEACTCLQASRAVRQQGLRACWTAGRAGARTASIDAVVNLLVDVRELRVDLRAQGLRVQVHLARTRALQVHLVEHAHDVPGVVVHPCALDAAGASALRSRHCHSRGRNTNASGEERERSATT